MIVCEYYPNCSICENKDYCYFTDDTVGFIEDKLSILHFELEKLIKLYYNKQTGEYYINFSFKELNYRINIILDDMFKLYTKKMEKMRNII